MSVCRNSISHLVLKQRCAALCRLDGSLELNGWAQPRLSFHDLDMESVIALHMFIGVPVADDVDARPVLAADVLVVAIDTLFRVRLETQHSTQGALGFGLFTKLDSLRISRFMASGEGPVDTFVIEVENPPAHVDVVGNR